MTATEAALFAAVIAAPADDLSRLVYADWLDENAGTAGDGRRERAAHIRWAVANPQNSSVCLCLAGWRQPQPCETCRLLGPGPWDQLRRPDGETHYVMHRGFIRELRGPLAAFWGERECGRCGGSGSVADPSTHIYGYSIEYIPCDACSGSGRVSGPTPGLVAVVRREPVVRVEVTDREPYPNGGGRVWYRGDPTPPLHPNVPASAVLPGVLYDLLKGWIPRHGNGRWAAFDSEAAARDALSAAILGAARG